MKSSEEHIKLLEQKITQLEDECTRLKNHNSESETEKKYQSLFEMSDDAILVIEDNTFVDCNQAVVKMLRYNSKEELLNTHPSELSPEKQPDGRLSYEKAQEMMKIALETGSHHFEWIHTRANGEDFPVEVWLSRVDYDGKVLINTIWRDLTEKKKAEAIILHNIKEKEVLLKEIHHRVKNNLQIVSSLLSLQSSIIDDEKAKNILGQSKSRIESMAKVHQMLYDSDDLSSINYKDYLEGLLNNLLLAIRHENDSITVDISVDEDLVLNIDNAVPIGLIINELSTNSLKHAFPNNSSGTISIFLKKVLPEKLELIYKDNGVGFSNDINENTTTGLGLQIINGLVGQLSGIIKRMEQDKGVFYDIELKVN